MGALERNEAVIPRRQPHDGSGDHLGPTACPPDSPVVCGVIRTTSRDENMGRVARRFWQNWRPGGDPHSDQFVRCLSRFSAGQCTEGFGER